MSHGRTDPPGRENRIDGLIAEHLRAEDAGLAPDRDDLIARHPDLAQELKDFFSDHDRAGAIAPPRESEAEPTTERSVPRPDGTPSAPDPDATRPPQGGRRPGPR